MGPFIWINFNPPIQGFIVAGLVEIGPGVLEEKILKFLNVFSLFRNDLPLEIGWGPSFEQTWISFTQGCIVAGLVEIGSVVLEKKILKFVNVFSL